jgi:hypothetical protein
MGDTLEVLSPNETFGSTLTVEEMLNEEKERVEIANQVQQKLYIKTNLPLKLGDMLRKEV